MSQIPTCSGQSIARLPQLLSKIISIWRIVKMTWTNPPVVMTASKCRWPMPMPTPFKKLASWQPSRPPRSQTGKVVLALKIGDPPLESWLSLSGRNTWDGLAWLDGCQVPGTRERQLANHVQKVPDEKPEACSTVGKVEPLSTALIECHPTGLWTHFSLTAHSKSRKLLDFPALLCAAPRLLLGCVFPWPPQLVSRHLFRWPNHMPPPFVQTTREPRFNLDMDYVGQSSKLEECWPAPPCLSLPLTCHRFRNTP